MNTFHLVISSPDGNLFDRDVQATHLRGADGDLAVLAGHVPFITSVKPCKCVVVLSDGTQKEGVTDGGVLTVSADITTLISGSFHW
ncbi:MAG: FoF1 ATP synthase subunit delta/epsilon [Monoglobaceae bacterium]